MIQTITRRIFVHSFPNPPAEDRSSDVNLAVTNSKKRISLVKEGGGAQTRYLLSVMDADTWLPSSGQGDVDMFIADLLLAANLSLREAVLSARGLEIDQTNIKFNQAATVRQTPEGPHISLTATMRTTVHFTVGFAESIDEEDWFSKLELIRRVDRRAVTTSSRLAVINLRKSLNEYENAMSTFERQAIFKHLFNALEMATDWNTQLSANEFDNEVAITMGVSVSNVTDWRTFYNRTKHIDTTPNQVARFAQGMQSLPEKLVPLRFASETVLLDRLNRA